MSQFATQLACQAVDQVPAGSAATTAAVTFAFEIRAGEIGGRAEIFFCSTARVTRGTPLPELFAAGVAPSVTALLVQRSVRARQPCGERYNATVRIVRSSDSSLLVLWGEDISEATHSQVRCLTAALTGYPDIRNLHPAYSSLLIDYDPLRIAADALEKLIRTVDLDAFPLERPRTVEVPVCYEPAFAPDLEHVAAHAGLTPAEVVALHSSARYRVYFLGFSPGFPYLGGLPPELATPRLPAPRRHVPAGSVAIGGNQAGIYPLASPGGWRVIGRTPLRLFDAARRPPTLLLMGDAVRFVPIHSREFAGA